MIFALDLLPKSFIKTSWRLSAVWNNNANTHVYCKPSSYTCLVYSIVLKSRLVSVVFSDCKHPHSVFISNSITAVLICSIMQLNWLFSGVTMLVNLYCTELLVLMQVSQGEVNKHATQISGSHTLQVWAQHSKEWKVKTRTSMMHWLIIHHNSQVTVMCDANIIVKENK